MNMVFVDVINKEISFGVKYVLNIMLIEPRNVPNKGNMGNIPAKGCMIEYKNDF